MRTLLTVLFIALLSGCAALQSQVQSVVDKDLALALPDLSAAAAASINDPNPAHHLCWQGLADGIAAIPPPTAAPTGAFDTCSNGGKNSLCLASAAQDFLSSDGAPITIQLPKLAPGVKSACEATIGELQVRANTAALRWSAAIVATLHKLGL
jgi:hypothetical protein